MKKTYFILLIFTLFFGEIFAQKSSKKVAQKDKNAILAVFAIQEKGWNEGNLEAYMQGYEKSDSLKFVGKSGITYGWKNTLDNYKRGYPDKASMGTLRLELVSMEKIDKKHIFVVGKWELLRSEKTNLKGYFTLIWKKINGKWLIIADHSS